MNVKSNLSLTCTAYARAGQLLHPLRQLITKRSRERGRWIPIPIRLVTVPVICRRVGAEVKFGILNLILIIPGYRFVMVQTVDLNNIDDPGIEGGRFLYLMLVQRQVKLVC